MARSSESIVDRFPTAVDHAALVHYLRVTVYVLTALLGLSLVSLGTIAVIAQLKGTWHWMIHLESMTSYMALFIAANVTVLVPAFLLFVTARRWFDA